MVAVSVDGEVEVHAKNDGGPSDHATLCGIDGEDSTVGQRLEPLPPGAKIDCAECHQLWMAWHKFKPEDFA
jgi:hypothetical protein